MESSDDENAEAEDAERRLPNLVKDQPLTAEELAAVGHHTPPPARYTEASLVKALEELGIGRPSTYESIMRTIQDRGYVEKRGQALIPSFIAFAVVGLLEGHYPRLVDYNFTAAMENQLDDIAGGDHAALDFLTSFYFGSDLGADDSIAKAGGLKKLVTENLSEIDARSVNSIPLFTDDDGPRGGGPGRPLRAVPAAAAARTTHRGVAGRPRLHPGGRRAGRADPGEGRRAVPRRRRRAQPRRRPGDRRAGACSSPAATARTCQAGERKSSLFRTQSPDTLTLERGAASCSTLPRTHRQGRRTARRSSRPTAATART